MTLSPILLGRTIAVLRGRVQAYPRPDGSPGASSAIAKQPVQGPVAVHTLGLEGDEQADSRVHGGPDKAVHHYAQEHYPAWQAELGDVPMLRSPGAFGENLASTGVTESTLCWGDRVRIGSTLLEVAQSRQPCWKLNIRFGHAAMARRVQDTGRAGWYYRVLEEGHVQAGDAIWLVDRPHPDWPLARVIDLLYHRRLDLALLREFSRLHLPPSWERIVQGRLVTGVVEDWKRRVDG